MDLPHPPRVQDRRTALTHVTRKALARRDHEPEERSTASLVNEAFTGSIDVLQAHIELAVLEVREDARAAVKVASAFSVSAGLVVLAFGFLLTGAAFALALVLPAWAACTIIGGALLVPAGIVFLIGRRKMLSHDFTPEHTIASLQKDPSWMAGKKS